MVLVKSQHTTRRLHSAILLPCSDSSVRLTHERVKRPLQVVEGGSPIRVPANPIVMRTHFSVQRLDLSPLLLCQRIPDHLACVFVEHHKPPPKPLVAVVLGEDVGQEFGLSPDLAACHRDGQIQLEAVLMLIVQRTFDRLVVVDSLEDWTLLYIRAETLRHGAAEDVFVNSVAQLGRQAQERRTRISLTDSLVSNMVESYQWWCARLMFLKCVCRVKLLVILVITVIKG